MGEKDYYDDIFDDTTEDWESLFDYKSKYVPPKEEYYRLRHIPLKTPGQLYTHRMPFYNESIPKQWDELGIDVVVSLLEKTYHMVHKDFYTKHGVYGINFPIKDFSVPTDMRATKRMVDYIIGALKKGANVAVHCHGGHGRTGMIVAIIYSLVNGVNPYTTLRKIRVIEPKYVETDAQENFVAEFVHRYELGMFEHLGVNGVKLMEELRRISDVRD